MVFDKENRRVVADAITIERRLSMLKLRRSSQRHGRKDIQRIMYAEDYVRPAIAGPTRPPNQVRSLRLELRLRRGVSTA